MPFRFNELIMYTKFNSLQANPDLVLIWEVGLKLWQREFPAIYEALQKDWSDTIKPIMNAIGGLENLLC